MSPGCTGITPIFPLWQRPTSLLAHLLEVIIGRTVERDGFVFTDVLPTAHAYQGDPGC